MYHYEQVGSSRTLSLIFSRKNIYLCNILNYCVCVKKCSIHSPLCKAYRREHTRSSTIKIMVPAKSRVTASRLKAAVCTNVAQPSQSLIKGICYPEGTSFISKATAWGCDHEAKARKEYQNLVHDQHIEFSISKNGLFIHTSYPFMGASPDGVVNCKCCGCGIV